MAGCSLLANLQPADEALITLKIRLPQIIEETPSLTDEHQQSSPTGMIFRVRGQVPGQIIDPMGEHGDLYFR